MGKNLANQYVQIKQAQTLHTKTTGVSYHTDHCTSDGHWDVREHTLCLRAIEVELASDSTSYQEHMKGRSVQLEFIET